MITLLGSLIGFISSMLPDILRYFTTLKDKEHELAVMDKQIEIQKAGFNQRLHEIQAAADIAESKEIYKTYSTGINWVDALNGSVRPVLAYAFFLLYAGVKFMQLYVIASEQGLEAATVVAYIWNVEDQAIFAGIISFYFGQRAMSKVRG